MDDVTSDIRELQSELRRLQKDVRCLHDNFKVYEGFLKEKKAFDETWGKMKQAVLTTSIISLVWAAFGGLLTLVWHGVGVLLRGTLLP